MTNCILLLAFDRVGKTTTIANTKKYAPKNLIIYSKHFTAPKVKSNPFQQYEDFIKTPFESYAIDWVLCDRGFPETVFFEQSRCGNKIPEEELIWCHKRWRSRFNIFNPTILWRPWDSIEEAHLEEINNNINHDESGEFPTLENRRREYLDYYDFMSYYTDLFPMDVNWIYNPDINFKLTL